MIHWDHGEYEKDQVRCLHGHLKAFNKTTRTDIIIGYYQIPSPEHYFLEIIGIFCNGFSFDFNLNPICLDDPVNNHLNDTSNFIVMISRSLIVDKQLDG